MALREATLISVLPFRVGALGSFIIAVCLCSSGCTRAQLVKFVVPKEDELFARRYVDLVRQNDFDQVEKQLDPSIVSSDVKDKLSALARVFPAATPGSIKVVAYTFRRGRSSSTDWLTLEYEFPGQWLLVDVAIQKTSGGLKILGVAVRPIADSLEHANQFGLSGKTAAQYAVLGLAVAAPLFSFYVFVVCLRTKPLKFKWIWAIFVLAGVGKLGVNWTTGTLGFTPVAINIPCGGAAAIGFYGPWIVSIYAPLGAILFLLKRKIDTPEGDMEVRPVKPLPPSATD